MPYFSAGDAPFFFEAQIRDVPYHPFTYIPQYGFGVNGVPFLWLDYPFRFLVKFFSVSGLPWSVIEKLVWIGIFAIGIYGISKLLSYLTSPVRIWPGLLLYTANTYTILLFGGGQVGVLAAYCLAPFVLYVLLRSVDGLRTGHPFSIGLKSGLAFSILLASDIRFALITAVPFVLCIPLKGYDWKAIGIRRILLASIVAMTTTVAAHSYWLLPAILFRGQVSGMGAAYTGSGMVTFLSVADFPHAFGLLHPNWPENLFGKVYFFRPEYLVIPIIGFFSLVGNNSSAKSRWVTAVGGLLVLLGAFLATGSHGPFGSVYLWLFEHIPGFVLYRDPTKWYLLTALGYSLLIPIAIDAIVQRMKRIRWLPYALFCAFWVFLLLPVFTGQVNGNLRPMRLTDEYVRFADDFSKDTRFSRTLWIPSPDKFIYSDWRHPVVTMEQLMGPASLSAQLAFLERPGFVEHIRQMGIGYIGIPNDSEQRMFLNDYKPDPIARSRIVESVAKLNVSPVASYNPLRMYAVEHPADLMTVGTLSAIYSRDRGIYEGYRLSVPESATPSALTIRYGFDTGWYLDDGGNVVRPTKAEGGFMGFMIPAGPERTVLVRFGPQIYSVIGLFIGIGSVILFGIVDWVIRTRRHA